MSSMAQKLGVFSLGFAVGAATVAVLWVMVESRNTATASRAVQAAATAPQPRKEGMSFEAEALAQVEALFRVCGASRFALSSNLETVYETSALETRVEEIPLTEADRSNGTRWLGRADLQGLFRTRCAAQCSAGAEWTEWSETLGIFLDDNTVSLQADGWHTSFPFGKPDDSWTCEKLSGAR